MGKCVKKVQIHVNNRVICRRAIAEPVIRGKVDTNVSNGQLNEDSNKIIQYSICF